MFSNKDTSVAKWGLERIEEEPKKLDQSNNSYFYQGKVNESMDNQRYRKSLLFESDEDDKYEEKEERQEILQNFLQDKKIEEFQKKNYEEEELKISDKSWDENESYTRALSGNFMKEKRKSDGSESSEGNNKWMNFDFEDDFTNKNKKKKTNNLLSLLSKDDVTNFQNNIMKDLNKPL